MQTIKIYKADFFIKKRFENSLKDIYSENKRITEYNKKSEFSDSD